MTALVLGELKLLLSDEVSNLNLQIFILLLLHHELTLKQYVKYLYRGRVNNVI